jgi:cation:H+ antiporter
MIWAQFAVCVAVILLSGTKLSKYGDVLAEKTGLGRTWVGVVLIASVTSLPEFVTGLSSVLIFDLPDIAVGNVVGACMMNMLLLGILNVVAGFSPHHGGMQRGHILTAAFAVVMLGCVAAPLVRMPGIPTIGWVGAQSFLLIGLYLVAMKMVFSYEQRRSASGEGSGADKKLYDHVSFGKAVRIFSLHSVIIIAAALYLPHLGEVIAAQTGLGKTFVGSVFIAISTTLPEMVVSIFAFRLGAIDMAAGNLYGSVLFNLAILGVDDFFYAKGALLSYASGEQIITTLACMMMVAMSVVGLITRSTQKAVFVAWDAAGMIAIYIAALAALLAAG